MVLCLSLVSCSRETFESGDQPIIPPTPQTATFTFDFGHTTTYAPIEYPAEKNLNSVAIFIETEDGAFYKFLTTEPEGSAFAFRDGEFHNYHDIDGVTYIRVAKLAIELPNDVARFNKVAVIGNYAVFDPYAALHSGADLTDKLKAVDSWDDLLVLQAPASINNVRLMPGLLSSKMLDAAETDGLWQNKSTGVLKLKRLAARITLNPTVYALNDDGQRVAINGWESLRDRYENSLIVFERLFFHNAKGATYLLPDFVTEAQVTAIPQLENFEPLAYNSKSNDFYVYGMTGNEAANLHLYVTYGVRPNTSSAWTYRIADIEIENTAAGKCLLKPNHTYEVEFPFIFPVVIADIGDWDEGWGIK